MKDQSTLGKTIFTPLEIAIEQLQSRKYLYPSVCANLMIDTSILGGRNAVLARQIATPNQEFYWFCDLAAQANLNPLLLEYTKDKYVANNVVKYHYGRLRFFHGLGRRGGLKIENINIIDFNLSMGKKISQVKTTWNEPLVDFHHRMLENSAHPNLSIRDFSAWLHRYGKRAITYYPLFLKLFVCDAILFEDFTFDREERKFYNKVFLPAFCAVHKSTGLKPLIVKLEPESTNLLHQELWMSYEPQLKSYMRLPKHNVSIVVR